MNEAQTQSPGKYDSAIIASMDTPMFLYGMTCEDFIKSLPDKVTTKEIINLANSYYESDSNALATINKVTMSDEERKIFMQNRKIYRLDFITLDLKDLGKIDYPKMSQAIFYSSIIGSIKHPDKVEKEVSDKIQKLLDPEKKSPVSVKRLEEALDKHLSNIHSQLKSEDKLDSMRAVLYSYQFMYGGEVKPIGLANFTVPAQHEGEAVNDSPAPEQTTAVSSASAVNLETGRLSAEQNNSQSM